MSLREKIVKFIALGLIEEEVQKGIQKVRMALPITANYDPKNEGYRRLTASGQQRRDLSSITQDRMFEIAYFMFDTSAMVKGLAEMDKSFLFSEPITIAAEDKDVKEIIDRFWKDPINKMDLEFPNHMMWLGLLGEQCWPVEVNKINGSVQLGYIDPVNIKDILVNAQNVKEVVQVEIRGRAGGTSKKLKAVRQDMYGASDTYGKLTGECFFLAINHPPNSPRGRSDFLTLFDWIDGVERYGFNYLERAEFMLNFIWDVLLKGMNEEQIREWLQNNPAPEPGSMRAHNENVEWNAVSPDLKSQNARIGFDMGKSFIMGALRRPESWFGGGGKAYQTEADQFGQIPIKDLQER
ncbi:MAG: hypothetical protein JRF50_12905 [Deltaproteobacteria bacterium]|nr:hypothetical protein [Deltaproteobacteria bacterium]